MIDSNTICQVHAVLKEANALVIHTGAGMGVDSGLPDYRGDGGQWGAVESKFGESVFEVVNPDFFSEDPTGAWSFFGARLKDYQNAIPHDGFKILLKWIDAFGLDSFVVTSNIDGQSQKAGFDPSRVREAHGSIHHFQAIDPEKYPHTWDFEGSADELLANLERGIYPTTPDGKWPARPNIYLFRDSTYINKRSKQQEEEFQAFLGRNKGGKLAVIEIGSGPHVQTIRMKTRKLKTDYNAKIIRINPNHYKVKPPHIGISAGALEALTKLDKGFEALK